MSSTEPSLGEFTNPNEMAVRVRVTPLLMLAVEGGQLNLTERVEAMLVYQAEKVYPDSPLLQGASSAWADRHVCSWLSGTHTVDGKRDGNISGMRTYNSAHQT